jgi:hypothetical protein
MKVILLYLIRDKALIGHAWWIRQAIIQALEHEANSTGDFVPFFASRASPFLHNNLDRFSIVVWLGRRSWKPFVGIGYCTSDQSIDHFARTEDNKRKNSETE